jgi:GTP-binding protein
MMKQPLVAIIGRPNVGKSTFFNRILKKRDAIVHDQPGVTRDRHYAPADWNGKSFMLVDTGGYMPASQELFDAAVREQVEIAIEEADVILFIVDQSTGITDIDQQIAEKLQRANVPVILIVNKVDNEKREGDIYEFYNLGLGDPLPVSALVGRGIGDMLDKLAANFNTPAAEAEDHAIKLAVIGRENVGKSSFVNTLLGKERMIVTPIPGTTRDPVDSPLKYQKKDYLLIDTAGLKRRVKVQENVLFYSQLRTMRSIQRADVVLYFMDAVEGVTRQDLRIIAETVHAKKALVIAVNKWDLIEKDQHTLPRREAEIREKLGEHSYIPIVFTSVLQKQRLFKLLDVATFVYEEFHKEIRTRDLNKALLPIIQQNSPPAVLGKEIKINYITQLKTAAPAFGFFSNHPELIPTNYRRFLERQIRNFWEFKGVPISVVFKSKHKSKDPHF